MTTLGVLIASMILLWILVLALAGAVYVVAREVSLISVRLGPVGARMMNPGPDVHEIAPTLTVNAVDGTAINLGGQRLKHQLLVFMSLRCNVCEELAPSLLWLLSNESEAVTPLLCFNGTTEEVQRFLVKNRLVKGCCKSLGLTLEVH